MSCIINSGYQIPCRGIGGLKRLMIGEYSEDVIYTYNDDGSISDISNMQAYYEIELPNETASFTQTGSFSNENNTAFYTKVIEFTLQGLRQSLINLISILGKGNWSIAFQDQNNQWWLFDDKNRTNVTGSTPGVGKAYGDLSGSVITMETKSDKPAIRVVDGFFPTLWCPIGTPNMSGAFDEGLFYLTWPAPSGYSYDVVVYTGSFGGTQIISETGNTTGYVEYQWNGDNEGWNTAYYWRITLVGGDCNISQTWTSPSAP